MNPTYIYGAGHYGVLTALDCEQKGVEVAGFIDSNAKQIKKRLGIPVLELKEINALKKVQIIIAVANTDAIREIVEMLLHAGLKREENFNLSPLISMLVPVAQS